MPTQTLRALERDGLVDRTVYPTVYPTVPPRVEYGLTALGIEAGRLTNAIADWSVAHAGEILASRQDFDERATAEPVTVEARREYLDQLTR
jgi:DNA-binding HxlR family transcriptional regulator